MSPENVIADLAPGDGRAAAFDFSGLRVTVVQSAREPIFARCYERLEREFAPRGEMEQRTVIESRLRWDPAASPVSSPLLYEMIAVEAGEELIAVRDHTAILAPDTGAAGEAAVVHLSHVLVEPRWRGSGLAAWLRAWPLQAARRCAQRAGRLPPRAVTLVAEMEPAAAADAMSLTRLRSYERAGFRKIDPEAVPYCQPDFRSTDEIDATGVRPVPLLLIVRRVGLEYETRVSGLEVRAIGAALYSMFSVNARPEDMRPLWALLESYPAADAAVALREPTA